MPDSRGHSGRDGARTRRSRAPVVGLRARDAVNPRSGSDWNECLRKSYQSRGRPTVRKVGGNYAVDDSELLKNGREGRSLQKLPRQPESDSKADSNGGRTRGTPPAVCRALGTEIVAQRTALGMTAKQVYVRAELPASYYYGIEGGSRQPSISVFLSVCEALAVRPREFWNRVLDRMYYPDCTRSPEFVRAALTPERANPTVPIGLR
jgi:hypothetical protein